MTVRGRGAQSGAVPSRFGLATREVDGDWLDDRDSVDGPGAKLRTTVTLEHSRSILTFNKSPDIPFDRSVNAYRGCEHGCIYREQTFRHLRCPELPNTAPCVAPCPPWDRCPCTVPKTLPPQPKPALQLQLQ